MIFQSITQAAWKTENYVFPTGVQLMTFWLYYQSRYYYYTTGDWWEWRALSQVHVQFPSNRSTISMRCSVLTARIEQSILRSPITVQCKFLSRTNLKSKSFHKMDVFFIQQRKLVLQNELKKSLMWNCVNITTTKIIPKFVNNMLFFLKSLWNVYDCCE